MHKKHLLYSPGRRSQACVSNLHPVKDDLGFRQQRSNLVRGRPRAFLDFGFPSQDACPMLVVLEACGFAKALRRDVVSRPQFTANILAVETKAPILFSANSKNRNCAAGKYHRDNQHAPEGNSAPRPQKAASQDSI